MMNLFMRRCYLVFVFAPETPYQANFDTEIIPVSRNVTINHVREI